MTAFCILDSHPLGWTRMSEQDYSRHVPAVDRALDLLEAVATTTDGLTSADLLEEIAGSRSGLYALINTLGDRGYLHSEAGRHRLGPRLAELMPARSDLLDDLLEAFRTETDAVGIDETVALSWFEAGSAQIVAQNQSRLPVRVVFSPGSQRRADSADALVMTAGEAGEGPLLGSIRRTGTARSVDDEKLEIAVPVCRDGVRPVAALVIGIPTHRTGPELLEGASTRLRRLAAVISHRIGAVVYQPYGWAASESVGPTCDLSPAELDQFLAGLWGAQLACVRPDGTPHVVPLWYEWDGAAMWMAASPGSSWRQHIIESPRVSVTLDEPWPPLRRAFLTGTAVEVDDAIIDGGIAGLRRRLAVRYLGRGATRRHELTDVDGWRAVRITPERLHGRKGLGGPGLEAVS